MVSDISNSSFSESGALAWPEDLPPPLIGRTHSFLNRSVTTVMESGRSRVRRAQDEALETMAVQWNFTADQYDSFRNFFIEDLESGVHKFLLTTYELGPSDGYYVIVDRVLAFLDGTYSITQGDNQVTVSATLLIDSEESSVEIPINPPVPVPIPVPPFPEPLITYSECSDLIYVDFGGFVPGLYRFIVEHTDDPNSGSWDHYCFLRRQRTRIVLNNYFGGRKWIRIRLAWLDPTLPFGKVVFQPNPPNIPPPQIIIGDPVYHPTLDPNPIDWDKAPNWWPDMKGYDLGYPGSLYQIKGFGFCGSSGSFVESDYPSMSDPNERDAFRIRVVTADIEQWGLPDEINPPGVTPRVVGGFKLMKIPCGEETIEAQKVSFDYADWNTPQTPNPITITVTCPNVLATIKWTYDGTDPTLTNGHNSGDTIDLVGRRNDGTFKGVIIARAFLDGCVSAPTYLLIHQSMELIQAITTVVGAGSHTASCDLKTWHRLPPECSADYSEGSCFAIYNSDDPNAIARAFGLPTLVPSGGGVPALFFHKSINAPISGASSDPGTCSPSTTWFDGTVTISNEWFGFEYFTSDMQTWWGMYLQNFPDSFSLCMVTLADFPVYKDQLTTDWYGPTRQSGAFVNTRLPTLINQPLGLNDVADFCFVATEDVFNTNIGTNSFYFSSFKFICSLVGYRGLVWDPGDEHTLPINPN